MARLAGNRIAWTYTADSGEEYRVSALKALTDQNKLGGSAAAGTVPPLPRDFKMRRITLSNATIGKSRAVPVYEPGAAILTAAATINVNASTITDGDYVEDSYSFVNNQQVPIVLIGEKHPRKSPVTRQST